MDVLLFKMLKGKTVTNSCSDRRYFAEECRWSGCFGRLKARTCGRKEAAISKVDSRGKTDDGIRRVHPMAAVEYCRDINVAAEEVLVH